MSNSGGRRSRSRGRGQAGNRTTEQHGNAYISRVKTALVLVKREIFFHGICQVPYVPKHDKKEHPTAQTYSS